jgi:hypothetical protein
MMRTGEGVQSRRLAMPGLSFLEASLRDPSGCARKTSENLRLQTIAIAIAMLGCSSGCNVLWQDVTACLLIIALIAALLGFGGIASAAVGIAKIVFFRDRSVLGLCNRRLARRIVKVLSVVS